MKQRYILHISLILCFCGQGLSSFAQQQDSARAKTPFIQGVEIVIDYGKPATLPFDFETKLEGGLGILFVKNILFSGSFGYGLLKPDQAYKNAGYEVEGYYGRAGLHYLIRINEKNNLVLGLQYGRSYFRDRGTFELESSLWGLYEESFSRFNLTADWGEVVIGSEASLWKGLLIGWTFRLRILNQFENYEPVPVYSIPGYGKTADQVVPALNLIIKYRFSFR